MKIYHIYAYKHYWPAGGIDEYDIPMPYTKDSREYEVSASSEKEAISKVEAEYGSGQRLDENGSYVMNDDGSWTVMGVKKVEILALANKEEQHDEAA